MKGRKKVIAICCLFLAGLLGLCGCSSPSSDSAKDRISDELVYESSMELEYAKQFSVDYYKDGYRLLATSDGTKILVIPEGKKAPKDLEKGIIVMQQPVQNLYLVSSSVMDIFDHLDALDSIRFSSQKEEDWYIEGAKKAMARGDISYAGKYSKPDYEQDLIRGIKKLIPLPVMLAAKRKKRKKQAKIIGITAACIILVSGAVGFPYIKDYAENIGNYNSAMELYNDGSYDDAKKAFALLGDFKNSKEMMQTCDYDTAMQLYYDGDYPQAAWAFRDMAKFKDSLDMQKKAELAWRRSLANVATDDLDEYSNSYYVINENGTVSGVDGNANFGLSIEKHGRIVSITASSKKLYALHEDGYVDNCKENNRLTDESEWHDIIKISRQLYSTNIALRADGTMLYGNTEFDDYRNDDWIKDIEQWTDIVDFELDYRDGLAYSFGIGAVIGIKSDGSLCAVYNDENDIRLQYKSLGSQGIGLETFTAEKLNAIVKEFSNVKSLSFQIVDDVDPINIMAITKDGKLLTYKNGKLNQSDAGDICTTFYASFMLKTNGDLVRCSDNKTVMHDIAKVCYEGHMIPYAITKTGNVYNCVTSGTSGEEVWEKLNVKALAYDEWISRLN